MNFNNSYDDELFLNIFKINLFIEALLFIIVIIKYILV
jgi:hypothetical protein